MKATLLFSFALLFSLPLYAQQDQQNIYRGSVSLGGGMLYGFSAGVRLDYRVAEQVTLNLGVGRDNSTPIVGAQYHFRSQSYLWQPRVGLHYGVVDTLDLSLPVSEGSNSYYEKNYYFKGFALELGQSFNFGAARRHGLDLAFMLRLGSDQEEEKRKELGMGEEWLGELSNMVESLNLGYRYNF